MDSIYHDIETLNVSNIHEYIEDIFKLFKIDSSDFYSRQIDWLDKNFDWNNIKSSTYDSYIFVAIEKLKEKYPNFVFENSGDIFDPKISINGKVFTWRMKIQDFIDVNIKYKNFYFTPKSLLELSFGISKAIRLLKEELWYENTDIEKLSNLEDDYDYSEYQSVFNSFIAHGSTLIVDERDNKIITFEELLSTIENSDNFNTMNENEFASLIIRIIQNKKGK